MANSYWITGLSGAGKTTIARMLVEHLRNSGRTVVFLDGDEMRAVMGRSDVHTRDERLDLALSYGRLGKLIASQGIDVVIATISLFHEVHKWNKKNLPGYVEIYLDVPLEELKRRDPKGIYKNSKDIAGLDCKVDVPKNPDVHLVWDSNKTKKVHFDELLLTIDIHT